ncbi:F0F1 ATP synthase subunit B [Mesoplasma melaleucae]|uniref:ATP synthase subunit b n=1 Tax=Mesoplasma melaleucae TaxID=81459 RepID=A0A2K8NV49_9MOLU|nr:F0F1 ATP synthase subunit B [Mesoplasma melaleucae]ATZ17720.1 F0F1 ATP synthase subunit B [Mesoplasma melaleucae]
MTIFAETQTAGVPEIITSLFPNFPNFIAHFIATIVLVVILWKLMYKPFRKTIKDRRNKINELLSEVVQKQTEANIGVKKAEALLQDAKTESSLIIQTSKVDADIQKTHIITEAHKYADIIKNQAEKDIAQERSRVEAEIKKTIVNVAFDAAEQILQKEINKTKNKQIVDEFIENLDK